MRSPLGAAGAALIFTSTLIAQIPGTEPNPPAPIPGQDTSGSVAAPQAFTVLPNICATTMGNSNNIFGVAYIDQRYQQQHSASEVGSARPLFAHSYRSDQSLTYSSVTRNLTVKLSNSATTPATHNATFATNIGSNVQTTVFSGNYNYPAVAPHTDVTKFNIIFPYIAPWIWDPTKGPLLLEVLQHDTGSVSYYLDAHSGDANVSRSWGTGTAAVSGSVGISFGLVVGLFDAPVPPFASFDKYGRGCPGTGGKVGVILPASMRTAIGNSNNIFGTAYFNQRYHQIFTGSEVGGPRLFNGHAFRAGAGSYAAVTITNVQILMGSTTNAPSAISTTFASNINGTLPQVLVFSGSINYPTMVPSTNPSEFKIPVPWNRTWLWTAPANEHLLYEYTNASTTSVAYYPNAHSGDANTSRLWGTGPTATTGSIGTSYGVVFCFTYAGLGSATPAMGNTGTPIIGKTFDVRVSDAKTTPGLGILLWGFSDTTWGAIPLPWALDPLGAKGCFLLTSIDIIGGSAINSAGQGSVTIAVPNNPALYKLAMFFQWAVIDAAANALGMAFSDGGKAVIGGI
jgi:hypothetical protein